MVNVLLYGDSITAGQYVEPKYRFSEKLRSFLSSKFGDVFLDVQAVSGQTSRQALLRFGDYINEYTVNILLIQLGINDANYWKSEGGKHPRVSVNAFRENILEMIQRAKLAGIDQVRLLTNHCLNKTIHANGKQVNIEELIEPYHLILREIVNLYQFSVSIYDIHDVWTSLPELIIRDSLLPNDGIHLSEIGHEIYFDILKDLITQDKELALG